MTKLRLDALLVERGIFESREKARRAILAGQVRIENKIADKPGAQTDDRAFVFVEPAREYVSRGADKLNKALDSFQICVSGRAALDAGASTGGFTEVLLERGARRVMAVDVGYGQLAWKLRQDPRVDVFERTNIRYLKPEDTPEKAGIVVVDLSFISLATVAQALSLLAEEGADFVFLIKPQFEAGKGKVGKGGIIRESSQHVEILNDVLSRLAGHGFLCVGLTYSPVTGADGNIEFLAHLKKRTDNREPLTEETGDSLKKRTDNREPLTEENETVLLNKIETVVRQAHSNLKR